MIEYDVREYRGVTKEMLLAFLREAAAEGWEYAEGFGMPVATDVSRIGHRDVLFKREVPGRDQDGLYAFVNGSVVGFVPVRATDHEPVVSVVLIRDKQLVSTAVLPRQESWGTIVGERSP